MTRPLILTHLGASDLPAQFHAEAVEWSRKAVEAGRTVAQSGASAEDIVESVVSVLEDCPVSDAGIGSFFNAKGEHQMDAGLMTGDRRYGAVASLVGVQNPIRVARLMVDDPKFSILVGQGAVDFARERGFASLPAEAFATPYNRYIQTAYDWHRDPLDAFEPPGHGTVGCVVRDIAGNIAAGTSTGGTPFAPRGRVGDSPFPGCGVWADKESAAVSATGYGEAILVTLMAATAAQKSLVLGAMDAARAAVAELERRPRGRGGLIMISKSGEYGLFHNTLAMPFAILNEDQTVTAAISMADFKKQK